MKTAMKFLTLGLIFAAFGAISVSSTYAQATDEVCRPLYDKFNADRKGPTIEIYERAVATGKEFLQKCSTWTDQEPAINYVKAQVPKIEAILVGMIDDRDVFQPFTKSIQTKDWATAFRIGKVVVGKSPDDVDAPLVLASIGFDRAIIDNPAVDTYNADAISMAKLSLQMMEQGKSSGTGKYGAFGFIYKSTACPDGKINATGWMNYTVGAIMFARMNQKKEALPFLYKATQTACETKDRIANVYRLIGSYYVDEFQRIENDKNTAYKNIPKKDDPTFAEKEKVYLDFVALQKGYMERVIDAYARGYKAAVNAKEKPEYSNSFLTRAKQFYGFRNGAKPAVAFESWLATFNMTKPFPDPTTAVTPIVEAPPTTAPTSMTTTTENPTAGGSDTRPRTAPATPATPGTTKTTPAGKKPAPKKKPGK